MTDRWLYPEEVARICGVTTRTIQKWCRERRIPHCRVGARSIRFTAEQIKEIERAYAVEPERIVDVSTPNPRFRETVTVVPMRKPA